MAVRPWGFQKASVKLDVILKKTLLHSHQVMSLRSVGGLGEAVRGAAGRERRGRSTEVERKGSQDRWQGPQCGDLLAHRRLSIGSP